MLVPVFSCERPLTDTLSPLFLHVSGVISIERLVYFFCFCFFTPPAAPDVCPLGAVRQTDRQTLLLKKKLFFCDTLCTKPRHMTADTEWELASTLSFSNLLSRVRALLSWLRLCCHGSHTVEFHLLMPSAVICYIFCFF